WRRCASTRAGRLRCPSRPSPQSRNAARARTRTAREPARVSSHEKPRSARNRAAPAAPRTDTHFVKKGTRLLAAAALLALAAAPAQAQKAAEQRDVETGVTWDR